MTGKSKFKSFCTLALCLAFLASLTVVLLSPSVSAGAPRVVGNPVLVGANLIAGGQYHSLALRADGTVWTWGNNFYGQLGDNTTTARYTPVRVLGLENAVAVAVGYEHSLALRGDGTVWTWGRNDYGQLGDNTTTHRYTPVRVLGLENAVAVARGYYHSLALRADGTVWTWGRNDYGQLGDNTTTVRLTPVKVSDLHRTSPAQVNTNAASTIIDSSATLNGEITSIPPDLVTVAGGDGHSLALRGDGTVWAWGSNIVGELGDNTTTERHTPVRVLGMENAVAVAAGYQHSLALREDGTVWAWGLNNNGQLGDNTTTERHTPVKVLGMENVVAVESGRWNSLALRGDGTVWAWGFNGSGELGDNTITTRLTPVRVLGLENAVAVAGGDGHSLALRGDGTVWAWGSNIVGELGDNTTTERHTPVRVLGMENAVAVAAGTSHSLAVRADGTVWTWGRNDDGQLGDNTTTERHTPVRVLELDNAVAVAGGWFTSLALRADGTVWAWGSNVSGQLGDNTTTERHTPVRVLELDNAVAVADGNYHSLAVKGDGTVWAWGYNSSGQLGDNTTTNRHTPVKTSYLPVLCQVWFEWGETTGYGNSTTKQEKTAVGSFSENLSGLTSWTTYHFRAVVQNSGGISYGGGENFKTTDSVSPNAPTLVSPPCGENTSTTSHNLDWNPVIENSLPVLYYVSMSDNSEFPYENYNSGWIAGDNWATPALPDGAWYWRVMARDNAGNVGENSENRLLRIDTLSPAAPLNLSASPSDWTNTNSFTISWTNPPENSGVVDAYYKLDSAPTAYNDGTLESGAGITLISGISVSGEGTHIIYVWLKDNAGNADHTKRSSISLKLDNSAPATLQVSSSTHPKGTWTNNFSPSFSWIPVGGPSPVTFYYKLEGYDEDWQSTSGTSKSYTGLLDGPCIFEVYAVDAGGTSEIASCIIKVDTSAPSVQLSGTLTGMGATATTGGWQLTTSDFTLTLSMTVRDTSGVTVYVNGQSVPVVGGSFSKVLTLSGGTNNFTIKVIDSAGNSTTRTLAVTQTVPAPPVAPPAGAAPEMVLFVIVVVVLIISGAAVIFMFLKPPKK